MKPRTLDDHMHELARVRGLIQRACDKCAHPIEAYTSGAPATAVVVELDAELQIQPAEEGEEWAPEGGWVCTECGGHIKRAKPNSELD